VTCAGWSTIYGRPRWTNWACWGRSASRSTGSAARGSRSSCRPRQPCPCCRRAVEVAAYRICTEALINIARHAHARQVTITVAIDGDLCLAVQDDGATSTANGDRWRPGTGLQSMNERVAEVGGTLEAGPTATGGRVRASLPLGLT
jgi:signal transduction histidine kinase